MLVLIASDLVCDRPLLCLNSVQFKLRCLHILPQSLCLIFYLAATFDDLDVLLYCAHVFFLLLDVEFSLLDFGATFFYFPPGFSQLVLSSLVFRLAIDLPLFEICHLLSLVGKLHLTFVDIFLNFIDLFLEAGTLFTVLGLLQQFRLLLPRLRLVILKLIYA